MKSQLIGKDPDAGKYWSQRRGKQRMRWLAGITDLMDVNLSKLREIVRDKEAWHAVVHGATKSQTWLSDWTVMSLFIFTSSVWKPRQYFVVAFYLYLIIFGQYAVKNLYFFKVKFLCDQAHKAVVHIHYGIWLSHWKNSLESVLMRWMKLEPIIQSEVSQKDKDQYSILMHIYGI